MLHLRVWGPPDGTPLLFLHGNCSSSGYWEPLIRRLPESWRTIAPDLRGYGRSPALPVDATRGLRDFADDVAPLLGSFAGKPIVVGHSMGAGVAMCLAIDHPGAIAALVLESPLSPYGFAGLRDLDGTPVTEDFAGTGAGTVNPDFLRRLAAGDRSAEAQTSPRNVMRTLYVADPGAFGADEEAMLDTVLSTVVGPDNYPGDAVASPHWPMTAPGTRGVLNALSPKYFHVADELVTLDPKPPIVWVRGDRDAIVSDRSLLDPAHLGRLGMLPGWPGKRARPAHAMVSQTRAVFERYAACGGRFTEVVYRGCGHSPHIERAERFAALLHDLAEAESTAAVIGR